MPIEFIDDVEEIQSNIEFLDPTEEEATEGGEVDRGYARMLLEEGPRVGVGIAGSLAGAKAGMAMAPPHPYAKLAGAFAGGTVGAFGGGALGEGATMTIQGLLDMPQGPNSADDVVQRLMTAGGEEALAEMGGRVAFGIAGRAFSALRRPASKGIRELDRAIQRYGGRLTASQKTDSWLIHQLDGLTRGSLTGSGPLKAADELNSKAMLKWQADLSNQIAATAKRDLTPREFGELVVNTVSKGKAAHSSAVGGMYSSFDDLVQAPVSLRGLKESAEGVFEKLARIKNIGIDDVGKENLKKILSQDETLSFANAQMLRSSLLDVQRGIKLDPKNAKLAHNIGGFVDDITKAMDNSAAIQGAEAFAKYQRIKKFARTGLESFNDKFISTLLKTGSEGDFSKIGGMLFKEQSPDNILRLRKAMRRATFHAKKGGEETPSFDGMWSQVKQGYLESFLAQTRSSGVNILPHETLTQFTKRAKAIDAHKMIETITNPKKNKVFNMLLDKGERESMFNFIKTAARVQGKTEGGLGMVMQLAQGGAIVAVASGRGFKGEAATLFIGPAVLAQLMTKPALQKILLKGLTTPQVRRGAGGIVAQLATLNQDFEDKLQGIVRTPAPIGVTEE